MRGSVAWMAPEVIQHVEYGSAADIWSFGCLLIEMATAKMPWGRFDNVMAAMVRIGMSKDTPPIPDGLSSQGRDFVRQCVQREQELRPTAADLLRHDLVRDVVFLD